MCGVRQTSAETPGYISPEHNTQTWNQSVGGHVALLVMFATGFDNKVELI